MKSKGVIVFLLLFAWANVATCALMNVQALSQIDVQTLGCDKSKLYDAEEGLQKLSEAMNFARTGKLEADIKELRSIQMLAKQGMEQENVVSFVQVHNLQYLYMLKHKFYSLSMVQVEKAFARPQIESMRSQINLVLAATDSETRKTCCEMLYKMIELLLLDLLELEEECRQPITINIEGEIRKIQIIRGKCDEETPHPPHLKSPSPPKPKTRTPEPPKPKTKTPEPPKPKTKTPEPPKPKTKTPAPPKPKTKTPEPPKPKTKTPAPPKPKTKTPEPPKPKTKTPEPPKPKTKTPAPPKPKTKTPEPPKPKTKTPEPPKPKTKTPTPTPQVVIQCVKGAEQIGDLQSSASAISQIKVESKDLKGASDYGYGFWVRWLTRYPDYLEQRVKNTHYFLARLTSNEKYEDLGFGDRTLAIWHYDNGYVFATLDMASKNPNVNKMINTGDIEGVWTYIYYSYSLRVKKATAFLKIGPSGKVQSQSMEVTHTVPTYLNLIMGGKQFNYPGFNGQITKPILRIGDGAFASSEFELFDFALKCNSAPAPSCSQRTKMTFISKASRYSEKNSKIKEIRTSHDHPFPEEYSISGWFKWKKLENQEPWHLMFRVFSTKENQNAKVLGDRDLATWIGTANGGGILLATYSYNNLQGEGQPNIHNMVPHKNQETDWFFVYFGYSFKLKKAHGIIHFKGNKEERTFENANHFLHQRLSILIAKDSFYPSWNGYIGKLRMDLCDGAYDPAFPRTKTPVPSPTPIKTPTPAPTTPPPKTPTEKPKPKPPTKVPTPSPIPLSPSPPKQLTEPPEILQKCIEGQAQIGDSSWATGTKPVADIKVPEDALKDVNEYGYGYWSRFLTRYPEPLYEGIKEAYYFMSRLTSNDPYDNLNMGDRVLAIWLGNKDNGYTFVTQDEKSKNPNVHKQLPYEDIEGIWTYTHFSYSPSAKKAVALIYQNSKIQSVEFEVEHATPKKMRFILGGNDLKLYPGFNGQFSRPILKIGPGSHIGTPEFLQKYVLLCNPQPQPDCGKMGESKLIQGVKKFNKETEITKFVADNEHQFPIEYAVGGWFIWKETEQKDYHLGFRVTLNGQKENQDLKLLGDRDLAAWVNKAGHSYHLATYSYKNMYGQGEPNVNLDIKHEDKHQKWHYIYFAYDRERRNALAKIFFYGKTEVKEFENINHYLAPIFRVFVGRDQFYTAYSGAIANFIFMACGNAHEPEFKPPTDIPEYPATPKIPVKTPTPPPDTPTPKEEPKPVCTAGEKTVVDSASDQEKPLGDIQVTGDKLKDVREYGYGFWMRYMTRYPVPLYQGKKDPWYFVSRLTSNAKYNNIGKGDRLLAIWQGQDGYYFITNDHKSNNFNLYDKIAYGDIEGTWTFVYFSYSSLKNKATAFLKYDGQADIKTLSLAATHEKPTFLRLIVGGTDLKIYPALNGQFSNLVFKVGFGSYIDTKEDFNEFAFKCNPMPDLACKDPKEVMIIKEAGKFGPTSENNEIISPKDQAFPEEYSVAGWFKWKGTKMDPWHLAFRLHINQGQDNGNVSKLGDRTLALWPSNQGIYAFATYSYTNLNGAGQANLHKNVPYKKDISNWHFVFFAYSRAQRKATGYVQFADRKETVEFDNINHYLVGQVFLNIGKDRFYPAWNGYIGKLRMNLCGGAFQPKFPENEKPPIVTPTPKKPTPEPSPETPTRKCVSGQSAIGDLKSSGSKGVDMVVPADKLEGATEYGYGFWSRFLTRYPEQLISGMDKPWYFVSRLTVNDPYDNIRFGDRTLAIWLGTNQYTFITNDQKTNNPNVVKQTPFTDIEGVWTYLHFSYKSGQAVGIVSVNGKNTLVNIPATHPVPKYMRLIIGGADLKIYPGFNGQISQPIFKLGPGSHIADEAEFKQFVFSCNPQPIADCKDDKSNTLINGVKKYEKDSKDIYEFVKDPEQLFPDMYSARGWFKWVPTKQETWHLGFRVTINQGKDNQDVKNLGDRTLAVFLGENRYAFATYSYANMQGAGQPNLFSEIPYKEELTEWHYIAFEYSREKREAYAAIHFKSGKVDRVMKDINHYLAPVYRIFVGKDQFYPAWNGFVGNFKFNICKDAYNPNFKPDEPPKLPKTPTLPVKPPTPPPKDKTPTEKPKPQCVMGDDTIIDSAFNAEKPLADIQATGDKLKDVREYGYSFWMRYLTRYPAPLYSGKKEPWYFISRLTTNQNYGNINKGDRLLAIWQGQGSYTFITNDLRTNNFNAFKSINYGDIEGTWTYVYYSYSLEKTKAVGFIKYGADDPQIVEIPAGHEKPTYLRLVIGGADLKIYPGFNGQFTRAVMKVGYGSFIENAAQVNEFALKCNPMPEAFCSKASEKTIIQSYKKYSSTLSESDELTIQADFPGEYAVSGWFKWKETKMEPWHLAFRLHINKEAANENVKKLGDRTLAVWASPSQNGIYAFATYTYTNLNGAGDPNSFKVVPYKEQLSEWHFIFYAYNKAEKKVQGFVQFKGRKEAISIDANHYLVKELYLNVGKDRFYPAWNGYIGKLRVNLCGGAFIPKFPDDEKPPTTTPIPEPEPEKPSELCLQDTKLVEVTKENIHEVVKRLEALEKDFQPERTCFCTLPKKSMVMLELIGPEIMTLQENPLVQRLIANNQVRMRT